MAHSYIALFQPPRVLEELCHIHPITQALSFLVLANIHTLMDAWMNLG